MRIQHSWNEEENKVGFYPYKYGTEGLGLTELEVLSRLATKYPSPKPIDAGSMERKRRNYQFLDTGQQASGSHASKVSRQVFARYKTASKNDLLTIIRRILGL